ncbi:Gfo/Idh/MocA family oxidoreductase [Rubrobacter calidifluminis]|uniref:Gfo/Idh/MocA family oxidoreductase n=1 Tax=Rubrobacter calidifluminis TaxID=1392640 RepID=UPI00235EE5B2|nr:Gfo/Idh/MocA family oxidoreductase [Rubrobacter calidifluminis]
MSVDNREKVRVGIVGVGAMGTRHADNLHCLVTGAEVTGVTDVDKARATAVAARCGAKVFEDEQALLEGVDAVVIASPGDTHAELVLECLRRGRPVLCEKPLATSPDDARRIVEAEVELGRRLVQVGFMRRYDRRHLEVKRIASEGSLGRPLLFKGVHRNPEVPPHWDSEFVIFDAAVHDLDSARWMTGREVEEVYVRGVHNSSTLNDDTLDLQLIQLVMADGCLGTIEVFVTADYGYEVGAELVCELGSVQTTLPADAVVRRSGAASRGVHGGFLERFPEAYVAEVRDWVKAIRDGRPPGGASAWDGYMSALATASCAASLHSGRPERIPYVERPELYEEGLGVSR